MGRRARDPRSTGVEFADTPTPFGEAGCPLPAVPFGIVSEHLGPARLGDRADEIDCDELEVALADARPPGKRGSARRVVDHEADQSVAFALVSDLPPMIGAASSALDPKVNSACADVRADRALTGTVVAAVVLGVTPALLVVEPPLVAVAAIAWWVAWHFAGNDAQARARAGAVVSACIIVAGLGAATTIMA